MAGSVNKVISDRQSRRGPGNPAHPGRPPDRQSADRDLGELARQGHRRAQGKDRVAPRRDLQRRALQDRRAVPEEGLEGLHRRPAADTQIQRQGRRREILDRGGAAELQLDADHARHPWRRWRRRRIPTTTSARRARRRRASPRWPAPASAATWTTKFRSRQRRPESGQKARPRGRRRPHIARRAPRGSRRAAATAPRCR